MTSMTTLSEPAEPSWKVVKICGVHWQTTTIAERIPIALPNVASVFVDRLRP
jgi:hypothetical protein